MVCSTSSASAALPVIRYAVRKTSAWCASKARASSPLRLSFVSTVSVASWVNLPLWISLSKTEGNRDYYKDFWPGIGEADVRGCQSTADVDPSAWSEHAVSGGCPNLYAASA